MAKMRYPAHGPSALVVHRAPSCVRARAWHPWATHVTPEQLPTVYLAAGVNMYTEPTYDAALAMVRAQWLDATLVHARDAFTSTQDWLERWPVMAPTIDALVIVPHPDGTTGLGVYTEATLVRRLGTPVYVVEEGQLTPLAAVVPLKAGPIGGLTLPQRLRYARVSAHGGACSGVRSPAARSRTVVPARSDGV